jgi:hypothetical protein
MISLEFRADAFDGILKGPGAQARLETIEGVQKKPGLRSRPLVAKSNVTARPIPKNVAITLSVSPST